MSTAVKREPNDAGDDNPKRARLDVSSPGARRSPSDPRSDCKSPKAPSPRMKLLDEATTLCVLGLKGVPQPKLTGFLQRLGLPFTSLRKVKNLDWALLQFRAPLDKKGAACVLKGKRMERNQLHICSAIPPQVIEQQKELASGKQPAGDLAIETGATEEITIRDVVTPFWPLSYDDQMKLKRTELEGSLRKVTRKFKQQKLHMLPSTRQMVRWAYDAKAGVCCPLNYVHPSPDIEGYRNKSEFTIGLDHEGHACIGFLLGRFAEGVTAVAPPTDCRNISAAHKRIATVVQEVVATSPLGAWNKVDHTGVFRRLVVRTSSNNDCLVELQVHPGNAKDQLDAEISRVRAALETLADPKVTAFLVQEWEGVNNAAGDAAHRIIFGSDEIHETLLGVKLRVSPSSFFQVNTGAAEVLCGLLRDWTKGDKDTVVLDVCCGTGNIGLPIAPTVSKVVGIELVEAAVLDARHNAEINGVSNAVFIASRAEAAISAAIKQHVPEGGRCIAIVDPPREGLHPDVLWALRNCKALENLIYVSCNHVAWVDNAIALCTPEHKKCPGTEPFVPVQAAGVDLFPHTQHIELIVMFQRGAALKEGGREAYMPMLDEAMADAAL